MTGYSQMPRIQETALPEVRAHIWAIYFLARMAKAKLIVELGVRSGESTRALVAAANDLGADVRSIDIAGDAYRVQEVTESRGIQLDWSRWLCCKCDSGDAASLFGVWSVDMLFVDTTHEFNQTRREIAAWSPKMRDSGIMAFHDTALDEPNRDGVLPAIRDFLAKSPAKWNFENHMNIAPGDTGFGFLRQV
jgi:predicted O-methyltransferase YrrM